MIDRIYKTVQFFSNNQLQGNVSPAEYNLALHNRVLELFEENIQSLGRLLNRENRRLVTQGLSGITQNQNQKIQHYLKEDTVSTSSVTDAESTPIYSIALIPSDLRYLDSLVVENQTTLITIATDSNYFNSVVRNPKTSPSLKYAIALKMGSIYKILPIEVGNVVFTYLRNPIQANWTYTALPGSNTPVFNQSDPNFQDVDIHVSEETNLTLRVLNSFGINLKENDLIAYTEQQEAKISNQENAV